MKLFSRKVNFGDPEKADVVIFDECNSHLVQRVINECHATSIFNQRPEVIWIGFRVVINFCRSLGCLQFKEALEYRGGVVIGILKQLRFIYIESCLDVMKPKAVVTYIDNSPTFGWLSKHCRHYPFIAIQNGSRLSYAAGDDSDYYAQHLFCYGEHETKLFPKLNYQVENFYPAGSLVASLYFCPQTECPKEEYDLLIVSTWRGNIGFQQDVKDTMRSMEIMDHLLARYIQERNVKAAVILRSERDSQHWVIPEVGKSEEKYYQDIYGGCVDIIETSRSVRNIFPLMQKSRVIVSCLSSALMEAFGIGKKVLFCNFTGVDKYHCDIDSSVITSDENYESFRLKLDELLDMPIHKYSRLHKVCQNYYMSNPKSKLTYQYMIDKIDDIIDKSGRSNVQ